jgi:hypothetical protein
LNSGGLIDVGIPGCGIGSYDMADDEDHETEAEKIARDQDLRIVFGIICFAVVAVLLTTF